MTKTLQEELLEKGVVKNTTFNKAMANPFSDKGHLNRFGKPVRWRIWLKTYKFPENFVKICCLCGRKMSERDRNKLVNDEELLTEIHQEFRNKGKFYSLGVAKICLTCSEIRSKEKEDGSSD